MPLFDEGQEFSDIESGDEFDKWIEDMENEEMMPEEDGERHEVQESGGSPKGEDKTISSEGRKANKKLKRKRMSRRGQLHREAPRPTRMSYAEWDAHRREGHVNFHPGCRHCVQARALASTRIVSTCHHSILQAGAISLFFRMKSPNVQPLP